MINAAIIQLGYNMIKLRNTFTGLLFLSLLFGCQSSDSINNNLQGATKDKNEKPLDTRIIPVAGTEYIYTSINQMNIEQEVKGEAIESKVETTITTRYKSLPDSINGFRLHLTYEGFEMKINAAGEEKELDAGTAGQSYLPEEKIFAAFNNASIQANIDTLGRVQNIQGIHSIIEQMQQLGGNNSQAQQAVQNLARQYLSDAIMKTTIEQQTKIFPRRNMKVGEIWTQQSKVSPEMDVSYPVTYKLVSISNGIANITVAGDVALNDQRTSLNNYSAVMSLEGKQKGAIKVNLNTGMIEQSKTSFIASGTMQLMGMEIPLKLENKLSVAGKQVH